MTLRGTGFGLTLVGLLIVASCSLGLPTEEMLFGSDLSTSSGGVGAGIGTGGTPSKGGAGGQPGGNHCANGDRDGDESDADCGGACEPCEPGKACNAPDDCTSGVCTSKQCAAPSCEDGTQNGLETDVDCGGYCEPCALGQACIGRRDCEDPLDKSLVSTQCVEGACALRCPDGTRQCSRFLMSDDQVVMEAESFDKHLASSDYTQMFTQATNGEDTWMAVLPDEGTEWMTQDLVLGHAPRLDYRVEFTSTGTFYLWFRATGADWQGDSLHWGLDGKYIEEVVLSQWSGFGWHSKTLRVDTLGLHTLHIWPREDGVRLDKVVINKNKTSPIGPGPSESPRN